MKNTTSIFLQYMENNKIAGHKKVAGFSIISGVAYLQFTIFPTITEWLTICRVWMDVFEQNLNFLHIQKI